MARSSLPPGFRFHPTDVELVQYYLKRKILGKKLHIEAIAVVDIYKFSPWDLPGKSCLRTRDLEWYFFCPRDKKHPNGARTNRATEIGFWKTTGKDRSIFYDSRAVGMKKTLVFHLGRAPQGTRTDWVIHEYRLEDKQLADTGIRQDSFVLCRLFEKSGPGPKNGEQYGAPFVEEEWEDDDAGEGLMELPFVAVASSSHAEVVDSGGIVQALPTSALGSSGTDDIHPAAIIADAVPLPDFYSGTETNIPTDEEVNIEALLATFLCDDENMSITAVPPEKDSSGIEHAVVGPLVIEQALAEFDQDQIFAGLDNPYSLETPETLGNNNNNNNDNNNDNLETELLNLGGAADFELYSSAAELAQGAVDWQYPGAGLGEEVVYLQHTTAAAAEGNNLKQPASSGSCYSSTTDYYCYNP